MFQTYSNKIGFSVLASAVLMNLLKNQPDAVGLSIYSNQYEYYAPEKGSDRHHKMLLDKLEQTLQKPITSKATDTVSYLHEIAEKVHRRSMVVLFTDMFQSEDETKIFKALQHLKHNKHKVVVFHVYDKNTEVSFDFDNTPKKFIDVETGEIVNLYAENIKQEYEKNIQSYFKEIANTCMQYKIQYVPVAVGENFEKILTTYLVEKQKFG